LFRDAYAKSEVRINGIDGELNVPFEPGMNRMWRRREGQEKGF